MFKDTLVIMKENKNEDHEEKIIEGITEAQGNIQQQLLMQLVTDGIETRKFSKNVKLCNKLERNKDAIGKSSYKLFKKGVIKQGASLDTFTIQSQEWEENKKLLKRILAKKVMSLTSIDLSEATLKQEIDSISTVQQQIEVLEGFSSPISIFSLYRAFLHLKTTNSGEIRKALIDYTLHAAQETVKQKFPMIGFIFLSIFLWFTNRRYPERVQEVLKPLYQLLAITLFGSKIF